MRRTLRVFAVLLALVMSLPALAATSYILRTAPGASSSAIAAQYGLTVVRGLDDSPNPAALLVLIPDVAVVSDVVAAVTADIQVVGFESDMVLGVSESAAALNQSTAGILDTLAPPSVISYFGTPVLGSYLTQPATQLINLQDVQSTFRTTGVGTVAIIDTGVDPDHHALKSSLVPGYDFVHDLAGTASEFSDINAASAAVLTQSTAGILDKSQVTLVNQSTFAILDQSTAGILDTSTLPSAFGHGTMVAGIVHLTAPTAKIMPLKAFAADGSAHLFDILRAVYYAADHGADVINMSFSLLAPSEEMKKAIKYASDRGVICVASAGNTGQPVVSYPAALSRVIAVGSTSNQDTRSTFSSYGYLVFMGAPGEAVITTYPGQNYAAAWGTSFSAPFVAGGTTLLMQVEPRLSFANAESAFAHAHSISPTLGVGRLDLYRAVWSARE